MNSFKYIIGFILLMLISFAALTHLSSCKEVDEWTKYSVTFRSETEIKDSLFLSDDSSYTIKLDYFLDFNDELGKRDIKEKKIEKITLEQLVIESIDGTVQRDFSFMKDFSFVLKSIDFPEKTIVQGDTLRTNALFATFNLKERDRMKELLKANEFQILLKFKLKKDLLVPLKFRVRTKFEIDARQFFI